MALAFLSVILWLVLADMWPTYRDIFFYKWILGATIYGHVFYFACEGKNILAKFTQFRSERRF